MSPQHVELRGSLSGDGLALVELIPLELLTWSWKSSFVLGSGQRRVVTATVDQTDMRGLGTAGLGTVGAASV